jgi:LL-diaminopimelate aminotransferase
MIHYADRVGRLPPYIFADLEKIQADLSKKGVDIISLGIGDPDLPSPKIITESMKEALNEPGSNNYPTSVGEDYFREAVARFYEKRFGVSLDPETEICSVIGSKEGITTIGRVLLNSGDEALLPDPGYPVYAQGATILTDAVPIVFPLDARMKFQPDFSKIEAKEKTKLLFLNYPSNPTGAIASEDTLKNAIEFCKTRKIALCYDNAYSEICLGGYLSPSILKVDGSMECAVEINSLSKTFNMTGYRVGFAVGNKQIISGLKKVKAQVDSGIPKFIQKAAAVALDNYFDAEVSRELRHNNEILRERLSILCEGLGEIGLKAEIPKATFYLWVDVGMDGGVFVRKLLDLGVVATPGGAFGKNGANYLRFSVTQPTDRIIEATKRIARLHLEPKRRAA